MRLLLLAILACGARAVGVTSLGEGSFKGTDADLNFHEWDNDAGELIGPHYLAQGAVFHDTRIVYTHWAMSKARMAANGPVAGWGDNPLTIAFVQPGTYLPATVTRFGLYVAGTSTSVKVRFVGADGSTLGTETLANGMGKDPKRWRGFTDPRGIASVVVEGIGYAIDNVRFDKPTPTAIASVGASMVGRASFDSADRTVNFDGIPKTATVGSHYKSQGIVFDKNVRSLTNPWALSGTQLASTSASAFGSTPLGFEFTAKNGKPAYASRVGFYVAGSAHRVVVELFDMAGARVAKYHVENTKGRDARRYYGFKAIAIHRVVVSGSKFAIDDVRFDAPRLPSGSQHTGSWVSKDTDPARVVMGSLSGSAALSSRFIQAGVVFDDARLVSAPGSGRTWMAANANEGAPWGDKPLTFRFVIPESDVPATVTHVGFQVSARLIQDAVVSLVDQDGQLIAQHRAATSPKGDYIGYHSKVPIAGVTVTAKHFAIDDLRFDTPVGFQNGAAQMVSESSFKNPQHIGFDGSMHVGDAVGSHYAERGVVFASGAHVIRSTWARSPDRALMATSSSHSGNTWGDQKISFSFVMPSHAQVKATVSDVGFYVAGRSATVKVTLLDNRDEKIATFDLANGSSDDRRWYGFRAPGIRTVQVVSKSYAIDDLRFNSPRGHPRACGVSSWGKFGVCSHSCGTGYRKRARTVVHTATYGGTPCPPLHDHAACNIQSCPIDCELGEFSAWTQCSKSCGSGKQDRRRSVQRASAYGGYKCAHLREARTCSGQPCPQDCELSTWGDWSQCTKSCGAGKQTRVRHATKPNKGGKPCAATKQTRACDTFACPVDCSVAGWGAWESCSVTCGSGTRTRKRVVKTAAAHGGKGCLHGQLFEHKTCFGGPCAIDCVVSQWSAWDQCKVSCNGSLHTRRRSIKVAAWHGGKACPPLVNNQPCNTHPCPIDCEHSAFSAWGLCTVSCGGGTSSRTNRIVKRPAYGGEGCYHTRETRPCNEHNCPIDCVVHPFPATWSTCTKSCGVGGRQSRTKPVTQPTLGGKQCPSVAERTQKRNCNTHKCPIDCVLEKWEPYTTCSQSCNHGHQNRKRAVKIAPLFGGAACAHVEETRECNTHKCPIDCVVTPWSIWSTCTRSCGTGQQGRGRSTPVVHAYGGEACPKELSQTRQCNHHECPLDCVVRQDFDPWTTCTKSCGAGSQRRSRPVTTAPRFGGKACIHLHETRPCNRHRCPIDCVLNDWGSWGKCTLGCGGGTQRRSRSINVVGRLGGLLCPAAHLLQEKQDCNTHACPVHCKVAPWQRWSDCSRTCGKGVQHKKRLVMQAPAHGGKFCPATVHVRTCEPQACPDDCVLETWGGWGECTKSCDGGVHTRIREVIQSPANGGKICSALRQTRACNDFACAVDCVVSTFTQWSQCSRTCGGGHRVRTRHITVDVRGGGRACPALSQSQGCDVEPCPTDCAVSSWSTWSECSLSCGGNGQRRRSRYILNNADRGGERCPPLLDTATCNRGPCGVNCEVSLWASWSTCTKSCGTGTQKRARHVTRKPSGPGVVCPSLSDMRGCNVHHCPVDCVKKAVGNIALWSSCDKTCGNGKQTRAIQILTPAQYGGKSCSPRFETRSCFRSACPTDCKVEQWGGWTTCTQTCGSGLHARYRKVLARPTTHGKRCPLLREIKACSISVCPVHCTVSRWGEYNACSQSCGNGGVQKRTRTIVTHARHGGYICPSLTSSRQCNRHSCPVACTVTEWGSWSGCSKTCGHGVSERKRSTWAPARHGGAECPALVKQKTCNAGPCPVDCAVSAWASFGPCSASCGGGSKIRMRWVTRQTKHKGTVCPSLKEERDCNEHHCPIDCVMNDWTEWSKCSATCGHGAKQRTRTVRTPANLGGERCPVDRKQKVSCYHGPCPQQCEVSGWGAWGKCTQPCGGGYKVRQRKIVKFGIMHRCPWLSETERCNLFLCSSPAPTPVLKPIYQVGGGPWVALPTPAPTTTTVAPNTPTTTTTAATTRAPTPLDCKWGTGASETTVRNGWSGNGWGDNFCSPCRCYNGEMRCSRRKKSCSKLKTLKMCSAKTTCSFEFSYKAGHEVMVVHSKPGETVGKHHHCAFNYSSRKCECRCWGPKFSAIWTGQGSQQPVIRETPVVQVAQPGVVVDQKAFREVPVITNFALLGTAAV